MRDQLSVEELVIEDSFRSFCLRDNETDILYWDKYIHDNPLEWEKIAAAKEIVLGLTMMLKQEFNRPDLVIEQVHERPETIIGKIKPNRIIRYAAAIAAIFALFIAGRITMDSYVVKEKPKNDNVSYISNEGQIRFATLKGEKKLFVLPDSTKLWLNAGSELLLAKGFGKDNRQVSLVGEALFDVTHNAAIPFIVYSRDYAIKVLGTLFNVKAYPGDKQSETSLLRGKVEIQMNNSARRILLSPNQKVVINTLRNVPDLIREKDAITNDTAVILLPLSLSTRDNAIVETAWSQNRLEIIDESFDDMKDKLERWFNVKITFKDRIVSKYRFSATFEHETIQQVLNALENAYQFKYETNGNEIVLSK